MSVHECSGYYRSMSTQEDGYYMNKGSLRYMRIDNASSAWKKNESLTAERLRFPLNLTLWPWNWKFK